MPELNGGSWRLSDHRGQVVLINYWASWCAPCRQETPGLIDLARDYRYKGLSIVGVSMDEGGKTRGRVVPDRIPHALSGAHARSGITFGARRRNACPLRCWSIATAARPSPTSGPCEESVFRADVDRLLAEQPAPPSSIKD